nr:MAG: hypothetical protein [Bacteriophage sp.]UWD62963.1 MAG: hypothetical protein [Bacteriophage sp.]
MERLTEKHYLAEDHYMKCSEDCNVDMDCIDCPAFDKIVERLAAYEDTGLTPEEIKAPFTEDTMINLAAQALGVETSRLRGLAEADKDGRVVVLPCKVGDKLYRVFAGEIFEHRVGSMKYFAIQGRWGIETYPFCPSVESSIGKTVFFTSEEAKKALREMEGKA